LEWQNSPTGARQTDSKNLVWFGEIERKLAKLSKTAFITVLPLNYFMDESIQIFFLTVQRPVFLIAFKM
jgi:hypothetical protein